MSIEQTKERVTVSDKIYGLEKLVEAVNATRAGKTVVHCHGVFDLVHIGHIRYLQKAKSLGDSLVVTVTPDRYVNKGPHRPVFTEKLRAEVLASLDCVDYVAVNKWPTATETIQLLKPDIYAKGAEYKENRTPEILREENALKAAGSKLTFIDDITSSSSQLINNFLSPFSEDVTSYLQDISRTYPIRDILNYIEEAKGLKVLVVGEAIIDEYYYCQTMNRSAKAPIVAMQLTSHERFAGGAITVANHLAEFCDQVDLVTMTGAARPEEDWILSQLKKGVTPSFFRKSDSPTIVKRRYREAYLNQPVFEVYDINDDPLTDEDSKTLCGLLEQKVKQADLVIAIDYGHSMMSDEAIECVCRDAKYLAVNTQTNAGNMGYHMISKYPRADFISLAEQELRLEFRSHRGDLESMLEDVARRLGSKSTFVTRGKYGCLGYCPETGFHHAPALATKVVDRVGAGDTFLSLCSICAVQGAPMDLLAFIGNVAGAEAVATVGHRKTVEKLAFSRHIQSLLK